MFEKTKTLLLIFILSAILLKSNLIFAIYIQGYTNAPDWSSNQYYTHQSWEFHSTAHEPYPIPENPCSDPEPPYWWPSFDPDPDDYLPELPLDPDAKDAGAGWTNNNGTPDLYYMEKGEGSTEYMFSYYPMGGPWCRRGYAVGMATGHLYFKIPNSENENIKKELWLQYVVYLPRAHTPATHSFATITDEPHNPAIHDPGEPGGETIGTLKDKTWIKTWGGGDSGFWWIVTEWWEISRPGVLYVNLTADVDHGVATAFDRVDIDTRGLLPGPPQLAWTGDTGFESGGVSPNTNYSGSSFVFRVEYTSELPKNFPGISHVWIDTNDNEIYEESEKYSMDEFNSADTNVSDGKDYIKTMEIFYQSGGEINYRFYFEDIHAQIAANAIPDGPTNTHFFKVNPAPPGPYLVWMGTEGFLGDGVEPDNALSGTIFEFHVNYINPNTNEGPTTQQVWIDKNRDNDFDDENEKIDMIKIDAGDNSYTNGCGYRISTTLYYPHYPAPNQHEISYRFYFKTDDELAGGYTNDHIVIVTSSPFLDWTGDTGFISDGITPNTNDSGQPFEFRIEYTSKMDSENFSGIKQVWIDINDNNSYDENEKFDMNELDSNDNDVTDGKIYTNTMTIYYAGDGEINYKFYFKDTIGDQIATNAAPDGPTNTHAFTVIPLPCLKWMGTPGFTEDGVEPDSYYGGTTFEFQVSFFDTASNKEPTTNQVWIDINDDDDYGTNEKFNMVKINTGDNSYSNGCDYRKSMILNYPDTGDGKIKYRFYFKSIKLVIGDPTNNHFMYLLDNKPVLSWIGTGDFVNKGVNRNKGKSGDKFEFQIRYTDREKAIPLTKQLWIDLNDNGNYNDSGEKLNMEEVDLNDTDYTDGKNYRKILTIHHAGDGKLGYKFYFNTEDKGGFLTDAAGDPANDQILTLLWESLNNVIAGPNPFKPNSSGGGDTITFNKLPEGTEIKVYTVSGKLAAALKEKDNNGKLEWKVVNDNGKTLASGMYLCHIKTTQGESKVIKIMVIR